MKHKIKHGFMVGSVVLLLLMSGVLVWFRVPYSPLKKTFNHDVELVKQTQAKAQGVLSHQDIAHLPDALQRYLAHCGYLGQPKMSWLTIRYEDVAFIQHQNEPALRIDYTQINTASTSTRLAFIDSSLYGVPFEGYDYYLDGEGGMKGMLGKVVTLFDKRGVAMDQAALVTYLAESLFIPSALLNENIIFDEVDEHTVRVSITAYGQQASGTFLFNDDDEMICFTTKDRSMTEEDGTMTNTPWSARCGDYQLSSNGFLQPTTFSATWHLPKGEFTYFDGKVKSMTYDT
ncbi:MAG: DUF6544 family protein [Peptococcaceae bacterium]|nr:DUF6544 family protein [Peptococcaceae bacterium]